MGGEVARSFCPFHRRLTISFAIGTGFVTHHSITPFARLYDGVTPPTVVRAAVLLHEDALRSHLNTLTNHGAQPPFSLDSYCPSSLYPVKYASTAPPRVASLVLLHREGLLLGGKSPAEELIRLSGYRHKKKSYQLSVTRFGSVPIETRRNFYFYNTEFSSCQEKKGETGAKKNLDTGYKLGYS